MLHDKRRKTEPSVSLQQRFPPLCTRVLFVVNTPTVVLRFYYIECELFAVFYKDFVRQLKAFFPSFRHSCASEMSPWWGHLIDRMDPSVGHLNSILAWGGGEFER